MCCITIDFTDYIMPASMGMKVVELMQSAIRCDKNYAPGGYRYSPKDQPDVSYSAVKPSQIDLPLSVSDSEPRRARKPLALE